MTKKTQGKTIVEATELHTKAHTGRINAENLNARFVQMISGQEQRLYTTALKVLRKPEDAQDAVQTALLKAFQKFKDYSEEERQALNIPAWLRATAYNAAIDILRYKKKQECLSLDALEDDDRLTLIDIRYEPPEVALTREETWVMFYHVVSTLPPKLRFLLWLRFVQNHEYKVIAELFQDSPELRAKSGALRTQMNRGISRIRDTIATCGCFCQ